MVTGKRVEKADVCVFPASSDLSVKELLDKIRGEQNLQLFDADAVAGIEHIKIAFFHADLAFNSGKNLVRDKMLEVILHAAASRQIADAVERIGVKNPKRMIIGFEGTFEQKISLLNKLKAKEMKWNVNKENIAKKFNLDSNRNLEQQIIERMVLLQLD